MPRACLALAAAAAVTLWLPTWGGCSERKPARQVVVYISLDQIHSEPILAEFQRRTGIRVLPVYDAESAKTTGLIQRLIARRDNPDCDVLWNNEVVQTQKLAAMRILAAYASPQAERFKPSWRDPQGRWTGFAARGRVILYNTDLVRPEQAPARLADLTDPKWRGQCAIARPFFGTTLTHMTVLHQAWGRQNLGAFLEALLANDVALCPGNAAVRDLVARGERAIGLTDTDDAYAALLGGKPVKVVVPDRQDGAVLIPNTVSMIANCPHPDEARALIDYLLSAEVEKRLAQCPSAQIPLGADLADFKTPWGDLFAGAAGFDVPSAAAALDDVVTLLKEKGMDR